jgi:hypothetical protein
VWSSSIGRAPTLIVRGVLKPLGRDECHESAFKIQVALEQDFLETFVGKWNEELIADRFVMPDAASNAGLKPGLFDQSQFEHLPDLAKDALQRFAEAFCRSSHGAFVAHEALEVTVMVRVYQESNGVFVCHGPTLGHLFHCK